MDFKKILIVDDDEELLELLKLSIMESSYEIFTAINGEEGLNKTLSNRFDLIITDIEMPKMNGIELAKKIRKHYDTPIIIHSCVIDNFQWEIDKISNVVKITKPAALEQLKAIVRESLLKPSIVSVIETKGESNELIMH